MIYQLNLDYISIGLLIISSGLFWMSGYMVGAIRVTRQIEKELREDKYITEYPQDIKEEEF